MFSENNEETKVNLDFSNVSENQSQPEETKVIETIETTEAETSEEVVEETVEQNEEDITKGNEVITDSSEYEYVTPHYLANAILMVIVCVIVGLVASYLLFGNTIKESVKNKYIANGFILTEGATATAADIRQGTTAYINGKLVEGTYIDLDTSTATAKPSDILEGYTAYVNGELITGTIKTYTGTTIFIPSTKDQKISKGVYLNSTVLIQGDANLVSSRIKKGVKIFGVVGTNTGK